jgi:hypothetical protein
MAAPVTSAATYTAGGGGITYASSIFGEWVQVHDNLSTTAITSSVLLNPGSYSNTNIHPLIIGIGTKIRLMTKFDKSVTTITTSPSVQVYGSNQLPDTNGAYPSGTLFWRLDASTFTASATALTMSAASSSQQDGTYAYSTTYSNAGYDLLGAKSVIVLHSVASSISGGADTVCRVLAQVIN